MGMETSKLVHNWPEQIVRRIEDVHATLLSAASWWWWWWCVCVLGERADSIIVIKESE